MESGSTMVKPLLVGCSDQSLKDRAQDVARFLSLPLIENEADIEAALAQPDEHILLLDQTGLALQPTGKKRAGATRVDFLSGAVAHRRQFGGGKGQQIAKACGIKGNVLPSIIDATAGLGRDAFVLATLGCEVQMLERNPVVFLLLKDGLERAQQSDDPDILSIVGRLRLVDQPVQAAQWLRETDQRADVIYCDPMFPHTEKSAQVKKEMLAFRSVVGADNDSAELLAAALALDPKRVVVKRPRKAPVIDGPTPSYNLEGKSGRFDIYALRKLD